MLYKGTKNFETNKSFPFCFYFSFRSYYLYENEDIMEYTRQYRELPDKTKQKISVCICF